MSAQVRHPLRHRLADLRHLHEQQRGPCQGPPRLQRCRRTVRHMVAVAGYLEGTQIQQGHS